MGLQGVTRDYKGFKGVTVGIRGYKRIEGGYRRLQGVPWVARGSKRLGGL